MFTSVPSTPKPPEIVPFGWDDLGRYKQSNRFLAGYPGNVRTFYSPVDDVHGLLASRDFDIAASLTTGFLTSCECSGSASLLPGNQAC